MQEPGQFCIGSILPYQCNYKKYKDNDIGTVLRREKDVGAYQSIDYERKNVIINKINKRRNIDIQEELLEQAAYKTEGSPYLREYLREER